MTFLRAATQRQNSPYRASWKTSRRRKTASQRQSAQTIDSDSGGHIILTPTQPVGSGQPELRSKSWPPNKKSRASPTELP